MRGLNVKQKEFTHHFKQISQKDCWKCYWLIKKMGITPTV